MGLAESQGCCGCDGFEDVSCAGIAIAFGDLDPALIGWSSPK